MVCCKKQAISTADYIIAILAIDSNLTGWWRGILLVVYFFRIAFSNLFKSSQNEFAFGSKLLVSKTMNLDGFYIRRKCFGLLEKRNYQTQNSPKQKKTQGDGSHHSNGFFYLVM